MVRISILLVAVRLLEERQIAKLPIHRRYMDLVEYFVSDAGGFPKAPFCPPNRVANESYFHLFFAVLGTFHGHKKIDHLN